MELYEVGWQTIGMSSAKLIKGSKLKQISTTNGNSHQRTPKVAIDENLPKTNIFIESRGLYKGEIINAKDKYTKHI